MPKKKPALPIMYVRKGATLKEIYAQARREFTAADLQKFTVDEPMIPARELLAELEEINKEASPKKRKKRK